MSNLHPLEVVGRGSEIQVQVGENLNKFFEFEIIINVLVSSLPFIEYLSYGSTAIRNIYFFQCGDRLYMSKSDVRL